MNVRPLNDKVLLMFPPSGRLEGGVWVNGATLRRMDAVVVAKGRGCRGDYGVGDTVVADRRDGVPLTIDGVRLHLLRESKLEARREEQRIVK